jgi:hypothetical protein
MWLSRIHNLYDEVLPSIGIQGKNIQTGRKKKIMYKENENVFGEETFQMLLVDRKH